MRFVADLHIHSPYSRAVSREMTFENLDVWAKKKGILVLGTSDFTHPRWMAEIENKLEPAEPGLFQLRHNGSGARFMLTTEISSIYSRGGKTRRVHNLIFVPSVKSAKKIIQELESRSCNLLSDGRPIIGVDSEDLLKIIKEADSDAVLIPSHAWTPWFSVFGSMSGFDSLEECFGDNAKHIFAVETGLSCYDNKTEALTESGWKKISEVIKTDKICTLNLNTEEIEYQKPQKIYRYKYRGKMYRLKTKRADLFVTPNHNLVYAPADFRTQRRFRLKEAALLFQKSKILRKDGIWKGEASQCFILPKVKIRHGSKFYSGFRTKSAKKFPIKSWLKFFGFWLAEGWTTETKNNGSYAVCICNKDLKLISEMKDILESFGYKVFGDKKTTNTIRVRDYQLFHYLQQFGKSSDKYIPLEIKRLSKELLETFFEYYIKGDGYRYGRNKKGLSATTISIRLRDDLQEIALKLGMSAYYKLHYKKGTPFTFKSQGQKYGKIYKQSADSWNVYFIRRNRHSIVPSTMKRYKYKEEWIDYDGMVYCVSVPNRTVYIRRNGIPLWCGNSDPEMNWRWSHLDKVALISNSDAHSLSKLGREANVFDTELSYEEIINAIKSGIPLSRDNQHKSAFIKTIEFFPEEGKYHYDGHRLCGQSFSPAETKKLNNQCPVCGRAMTIGVLNRVESLADRPEGFKDNKRILFQKTVPLEEIIAEVFNVGVNSKKVRGEYEKMLTVLGNEIDILTNKPEKDLWEKADKRIVEGILKIRQGEISAVPGYDGEYGKIKILGEDNKKADSPTLF